MKLHLRKLTATLVVLLILSLTACSDDALKKVATGLNGVADGVAALQTTAITANSEQLLTDEQTTQVLQIAIKIDMAGKQADQITRNISALSAADRSSLVAILQPIIAVVNDEIINAVNGIQDVRTRQSLQLVLLSIQTSLNTVNLILTQ